MFIVYKSLEISIYNVILPFSLEIDLQIKNNKEFMLDFQKITKKSIEFQDKNQLLIIKN